MSALRTAVAVAPDESAARRDLRAQIARLEAAGGRAAAVAGGPRLLSLADLATVRDALVQPSSGRFATQAVGSRPLDAIEGARGRLERMIADPGAHRRERVALAELGLPGCGVYRVAPRLGLIGMLAGWWEITLSSGCP
jgi:hypothetical protein